VEAFFTTDREAMIGASFEGNCFGMGSMPNSSSENSYDGSTVFREKACDADTRFNGAFFLSSTKELLGVSSNEL
jgi:hypothetical protein